MLNLQTKVNIPQPEFSINYNSNITLFGSCFASNIGDKLYQGKFNSLVNPFGILYNPASICQVINLLFDKDSFQENELNLYNELWHSPYFHTSFSNTKKELCLQAINKSFQEAKSKIQETDVLIVTLGTAWAYRSISSNKIVSNCHKIPAKEFSREYLNPEQIHNLFSETINQLISINPNLKIVFTVSPIRHWKDGAIENMRSKASLLLAIKELEKSFPQSYYLPIYEVFMDELRDYRFYKSDMLHPSDLAIDYVWELFKQNFFEKETNNLYQQVEKLVRSFNHRAFNTQTNSYKKFKTNLISQVKAFELMNPGIDFTKELSNLK